MDAAGNVYVADGVDEPPKEWNASTQTLSTVAPLGFNEPTGVTVDALGNVYVVGTAFYPGSESTTSMIGEWNAATKTYSVVVSSGLSCPQGVAVDASGNLYIANGDSTIKEWNAATQTLSTLVSAGLSEVQGVAVDGAGNVFIADSGDKAIKEWNAATKTLSTLVSSGLQFPTDIAVDAAGNVYVLDIGDNVIEELPRAFVPGGPISEGRAAGSDALATVLPSSAPLTGIFAPSSDQSWLTIGKVAGGVVDFAMTEDTGAARTAHITVLGQQIAVTQANIATVTGVSPASGPAIGGALVTITGANLLHATAVKFGARAVTRFISDSATKIVVKSPPGASTVYVTVMTADGASTACLTDKFTYIAAHRRQQDQPRAGIHGRRRLGDDHRRQPAPCHGSQVRRPCGDQVHQRFGCEDRGREPSRCEHGVRDGHDGGRRLHHVLDRSNSCTSRRCPVLASTMGPSPSRPTILHCWI